LFDFGGVLAEEGFRGGLEAIARSNGLDPERVVRAGYDLVYRVGYVVGRATEKEFWNAMRKETGVQGSDGELRGEILERFTLRPWMLDVVRRLRDRRIRVAVLSDQSDWLEALDRRDGFFASFDAVFNSYRLGKTKKDLTTFTDVLTRLRTAPNRALFIDDHRAHVDRARGLGIHTILYEDRTGFLRRLSAYCPFLTAAPQAVAKTALCP
jgi:putative hydrolase of the HAD superfamily